MKRTISVLLAMAVVAALVAWAPLMKHNVTTLPVVHAQGGCSNATLTGNYGFLFTGFNTRGPDHKASEIPFDGVGLGTSDGAGNFTANFTFSENGAVYGNNPYTATYTVNSDCTGLMTSTDGNANMSFVIVSGGAEVLFADIDAGNTWTMDAKKAPTGCNNATLTGNYGFTFSGFSAPAHSTKGNETPFAGEGVGTFDGAGNVSATYNNSANGGIYTNNPYAATYSVNSDCSGTVSGAPGGNADGASVIVSDGAEVFFMQTDAGGTWTADFKKQ